MSEYDLYPGVQNYVDLEFVRTIRPRSDQQLTISQITARAGPAGSGTWSRPDLALLSLWKHKYSPSMNLDLYGFEVKTEAGGGVTGVHEALAHTRILNFSTLVWEYPSEAFEAASFRATLDNCRHFGIGLTTFQQSQIVSSYRVHVKPARKEPEPDAVDEFIDTRFTDGQKELLLSWLPKLDFSK